MIKIYKIILNETNDVWYIGQTKRDLDSRFSEHEKDFSHPEKVKFLRNNVCRIELIEEVLDKMANERETHYINMYQTLFKLNKNLPKKNKNHIIHKIKKEEKIEKNLQIAKDIIKNITTNGKNI